MSFESPGGAPTPEDAAPFAPPAPLTPPPPMAPPMAQQPYAQPQYPEQQSPYAQPGQYAQPGGQPEQPFQQPAPFTQQQQFQPTPPYGAAQYPPPYAQPYGAYPPAPPGLARQNSGLSVALIVLGGIYVLLCIVTVLALNHRVSLANQLINDPTSFDVNSANSADNLVSGLSLVAILTFLTVVIVLSVWMRSLRRALLPTGRYQQVLKDSGYQIFRVVWIVSILLAVVLRGSGTIDTPQDVVSHDHQYMIYYGIRAALGGVLIFFTIRIKRVSDNAVMLAQSGYSPEAAGYLAR